MHKDLKLEEWDGTCDGAVKKVEIPEEQAKETVDRMWKALGVPESDWSRLTSEAADYSCSQQKSEIMDHSTGEYIPLAPYSGEVSLMGKLAVAEQTSFDWSAAAIGAFCGGLATFAAMKSYRRKQQQKAPLNDAFI